MTDLTNTPAAKKSSSLLIPDARTRKRNAKEARFKFYGQAAIAFGLLMLVILVVTIVSRGSGAFQQSFVRLDVELLENKIDKKGNRNLEDIRKVSTFGYAPLITSAFEEMVRSSGITTELSGKKMAAILSKGRRRNCATM